LTLKARPFSEPVYVTRPVLPDLGAMTEKLKEVWESQWLTNKGLQQDLLEKELLYALKVPNVSLFNNGTTALMVACRGLGLSGEVVTSPYSFPATPHALAWEGIKPVFCDIRPDSMNIDPDRIEALITPRTTGILAGHIYGTPCDVDAIENIAEKHGLKVVYDAAHAFGVEIGGVGIGAFGDMSVFSFHATKLFHSVEGGAISCRDGGLKANVDLMKNFGIKGQEEVLVPGINGKMNELQAAVGLLVLGEMEHERRRRKTLLDAYRECLSDLEGVSCFREMPGVTNGYQYFVIRIDEKVFGCSRDFVHEEFRKYNVFTRKYFYPLCSEYPCYRDLPSSEPSGLPVAHRVAREVLCLPYYGGLSVEDVVNICNILKGFAGRKRL
jgi:dTDP-4-amino-4,6-dideoxygalactose transaminase